MKTGFFALRAKNPFFMKTRFFALHAKNPVVHVPPLTSIKKCFPCLPCMHVSPPPNRLGNPCRRPSLPNRSLLAPRCQILCLPRAIPATSLHHMHKVYLFFLVGPASQPPGQALPQATNISLPACWRNASSARASWPSRVR